MTNRFSRRALACALLATTALATPAFGQAAPSAPPPIHSNVDANGVDLVTGKFIFSMTEAVIGSGPGALALKRIWSDGVFKDNWSEGVYVGPDGNTYTDFGNTSNSFTSSGGIRDKVAASKRKGIFMGGVIPLGYKLGDRKLLIDDAEAATVRVIFERYVALRSIGRLADELAAANFRTKVRHYKDGSTRGGALFRQGPLSWLLNNPVYIGKVAFKGELHEGEHEAIIDAQLWQQVQSIMSNNRNDRRLGKGLRCPSLLTGMLTDPEGRAMTPTFTTRGSQRHHYYITRLKPGEDRKTAWRIPAGDVDKAVLGVVADWLRSTDRVTKSQDAAAVELELHANAAIGYALPSMSIQQTASVAASPHQLACARPALRHPGRAPSADAHRAAAASGDRYPAGLVRAAPVVPRELTAPSRQNTISIRCQQIGGSENHPRYAAAAQGHPALVDAIAKLAPPTCRGNVGTIAQPEIHYKYLL